MIPVVEPLALRVQLDLGVFCSQTLRPLENVMKLQRVLIGVAALAMVLTACGDEVVFVDLQAGQCFDNPQIEGSTLTDVDVVDCDEPHLAEVFARLRVDGGDEFPGNAAVAAVADTCTAEPFSSYVGSDYNASIYYSHSVSPTAETWEAGDRHVMCILSDNPDLLASSQIEGSVRNSGQ